MEDMPSETISKIHLVDLAGRFVIRWFAFLSGSVVWRGVAKCGVAWRVVVLCCTILYCAVEPE